jgi:Tetratricopeptide repeat
VIRYHSNMAVQDDAFDELVEWSEDVFGTPTRASIGARCIILPVPQRWGRSTVLARFVDHVNAIDEPGALAEARLLSAAGALDTQVLQADWLHHELRNSTGPDGAAVFGFDSTSGLFNRALGASDAVGLLGGRAGSIVAFLAAIGVDVLGGRESSERAKAFAAVSRLAWRVAQFSANQFPIALVIDDAENLDGQLLQQFVGGLTNPVESRVLVVVACDPKHTNYSIVRQNELLNAARRIQSVDVSGSMDIDHRLELIRAKTIDWPSIAVDRLASGSTSYGQIFDVLDLGGASDISTSAIAAADVDDLIAAAIPTKATAEMALLTMLGGLVHVATYDALRRELGPSKDSISADIEVSKYIVRLAERSEGGLSAGAVASMLSAANRVTIVNRIVPLTVGAVETVDDPFERIALVEPVWKLVNNGSVSLDKDAAILLETLAKDRFALGDKAPAGAIAEHIAGWLIDNGLPVSPELLEILVNSESELLLELPPSTLTGTEARLRHTAFLLRTPATVEAALDRLDDINNELNALPASELVDGWRLHLAYRLVRSEHPTLASEVLAPMLSRAAHDPGRMNAERVLFAVGHAGELLLQRAAFRELYESLDERSSAQLRLAILDALTGVCSELGDWQTALNYGAELLELRVRASGFDDPNTLNTRNSVAVWTGECGDPTKALGSFELLLPDWERVLGADHPNTLATRNNVAAWTGRCGDPVRALALFKLFLPDQVRVLGDDHPDTLTTRNNVAAWTGRCGDPVRALVLSELLLPDRVRVLGADHPNTLATRSNVAAWTGECGDPAGALVLSELLLPDQVRVELHP